MKREERVNRKRSEQTSTIGYEVRASSRIVIECSHIIEPIEDEDRS
jgi:hypothetical protein